MLENQFIQLRYGILGYAKYQQPLPCPMDEQGYGYKIFYETLTSGATAIKIAIVDENDALIDEYSEESLNSDNGWLMIFGEQGSYLERAEESLTEGQRFFLRLTSTKNGNTYKQYSQPLIFVPRNEFALFNYWCNEDAFGFPFYTISDELHTQVTASMPLPIHMHNPQPIQDNKTYVKADGSVVTLYAKYYKEWECVTDFLSEAMHDKIVAALSCDEVYINGKRVTKSDNYQVDWENYDLDCDGVTKLAKATFKVREHITQRNSNY